SWIRLRRTSNHLLPVRDNKEIRSRGRRAARHQELASIRKNIVRRMWSVATVDVDEQRVLMRDRKTGPFRDCCGHQALGSAIERRRLVRRPDWLGPAVHGHPKHWAWSGDLPHVHLCTARFV